MKVEIIIDEEYREPKTIVMTDQMTDTVNNIIKKLSDEQSLVIACILMFPIAYFANWMQHSFEGILSYVCIFLVIFIIIWLIQYFMCKRNIKKINERVATSKHFE